MAIQLHNLPSHYNDSLVRTRHTLSKRLVNSEQEKHRKKALDVIFFPMYDVLTSPLVKIVGANACPTMTATPETVKAAFTKENDVFAEHNVKYLDPVLSFADRKLFAHQMLQAWQPIMGLSQEENDRAVEVGYQGWQTTKQASDTVRAKSWTNSNAKIVSAS